MIVRTAPLLLALLCAAGAVACDGRANEQPKAGADKAKEPLSPAKWDLLMKTVPMASLGNLAATFPLELGNRLPECAGYGRALNPIFADLADRVSGIANDIEKQDQGILSIGQLATWISERKALLDSAAPTESELALVHKELVATVTDLGAGLGELAEGIDSHATAAAKAASKRVQNGIGNLTATTRKLSQRCEP
jgi:hypothetical protein